MRTPGTIDMSTGTSEVSEKGEIPEIQLRKDYSNQTDSYLSRVPTQMGRGMGKTQLFQVMKRAKEDLTEEEFDSIYSDLKQKYSI